MFTVQKVLGDGRCLFRSIAKAYHQHEKYYEKVRATMCAWAEKHLLPDDSKHPLCGTWSLQERRELVRRLRNAKNPKSAEDWGTNHMVWIAEYVYNIRTYIWLKPQPKENCRYCIDTYPHPTGPIGTARKVIHLLYNGVDHFDALQPNTMLPNNEYRSCGSVYEQHFLDVDEDAADSVGLELDLKSSSPEEELFALHESTTPSQNSLKRSETISSCVSENQSSNDSNSSRKSYKDFLQSVLVTDLVSDVLGRLPESGRCCSDNCIHAVQLSHGTTDGRSDGTTQVLRSSKIPNVEEVIRTCRESSARMGCTERSKWLFEQYRKGFRMAESDGPVCFAMPLPFCTAESQTEGGSIVFKNAQVDVCLCAFKAIYCVSKSMDWRFRKSLTDRGVSAVLDKDIRDCIHRVSSDKPECRDLSAAELQAIAYIKVFCERTGEKMPHKKEYTIRISYPKKIVYDGYKNTFLGPDDDPADDRKQPGKPLGLSKFYELWNDHCAYIQQAKWKGDFAICDICKQHAQIDCNPYVSEEEKVQNRLQFQKHLAKVQWARKDYAVRQQLAMEHPSYYMSMIIDGCDSNTTLLPNIKSRSKSEEDLSKHMLKCKLMGVRVHGYRKRDYLFFAPPFIAEHMAWQYTIECLARTFKYEEEYRARQGLGWPKVLYLQMDNTSRDNKNSFLMMYLSYLVEAGIFQEIHLNFLPVGHTHEDIDQMFSVITRKLLRNDAYTFPQWVDLVKNAYNDELDRIYLVDLVRTLHDYRPWLDKHAAEDTYHEYRSEVFYFHFIKEEGVNGRCVWYYAEFSYCRDRPGFGGMWPKPPIPPGRWLGRRIKEAPVFDRTCGTWYDKSKGEDVLVDRVERLDGIRSLLRLSSNCATEADVQWWEDFFNEIPQPGDDPNPNIYWSYSVPDVAHINRNIRARNIDLHCLDDVEPDVPPACELIICKGWTATQKRKFIQAELEEQNLEKNHEILERNTFVCFLISDDWKGFIKEQEGLPSYAFSFGFLIGRVIEGDKDNARDSVPVADRNILVEVYHPNCAHGTSWIVWNKRSHDGRKGSPWIVDIPRLSVCVTKLEFCKSQSRWTKKLKSTTLKKIAECYDLGLAYVENGKGFMSRAEAEKILQENYNALAGADSKEGRRAKSRAASLLTAHQRITQVMEVHAKKRRRKTSFGLPAELVKDDNSGIDTASSTCV